MAWHHLDHFIGDIGLIGIRLDRRSYIYFPEFGCLDSLQREAKHAFFLPPSLPFPLGLARSDSTPNLV